MFFFRHSISSFFAWLLRQPYGGVMTGLIIGSIAAGLAAIFWYAWRCRWHEISEMERLSHKRGWAFRKRPMPGVTYSIEGRWKDGTIWSTLRGSFACESTCFVFLMARSGNIDAKVEPKAWILADAAVDLSSPFAAASSAATHIRSKIDPNWRFVQISKGEDGVGGLVVIAKPEVNLVDDSEFKEWLITSASELVNREHATGLIVIRADDSGVHMTLEKAEIRESTLDELVAGARSVMAAHSRVRATDPSSLSSRRMAA